MPNPIQVLSLSEFQSVLDAWVPLRKIREVHIHCTDHPRKTEFRGMASVEAMRRFHQSIGMSDIAQHLTADPQGLLWTGRPFDAMPASVRGHNGTSQAGPFMIEMVGLFDKGAETLENPQKAAVQAVVCAVLRKFDLDETAVKFHREFPATGKTCPGTSLDPSKFRAEIGAALSAEPRSFVASVPRSLERAPLDRDGLFGRGSEEDTTFSEVPEDHDSLDEQVRLARWIDRGLLDPVGATGREVKETYRELLPYVINTSQGLLSKMGAMETHPEDLDTLIDHHLTAAFDSTDPGVRCQHLLFYAHGGLVNEEGALDYAKAMVPWWRANGVYPIYFIWESSLFQALWQKPRELARGPVARGDFTDKILEGATQKLARIVWRRMKANARRCSAEVAGEGQKGGLWQFWEKLEPWLQKRKANVQLHAIGHSTGPILLSSFMPLLIGKGFEFSSLNYLAPAIRTDDFLRDVKPLVKRGQAAGIRRLRQFTMNDDAEREDNVAKIYTKSLLYYVREACEDDTNGRIMGLERDLYGNSDTRSLFGLPAKPSVPSASSSGNDPLARVEFAAARDAFPKNPRTQATAHGCFDNEEATMTSVLLGIVGKTDPSELDQHHPFPWEGSSACGGDDASRDLDEDWTAALASGCCCSCQGKPAASNAASDDFDLPPDDSGDGDAATAPPSAPERSGSSPGGKRIALCVGINAYPRQSLSGCVQDSRNWAAALRRNGFEVRELHDKAATRANLTTGLRTLIRDAQPGDQLVFQYSGHGSQVDDLSGDETDRFDEVVVPVDFDKGALLIDDDIYELCQGLRKGATLTFLMDCCHSGTNTRFAPGVGSRAAATPRFLQLSSADVKAHKKVRKGMRSAPPVDERVPLPGVVSFAACRDNEVAWEEDGEGNFSRHSMAVFDEVFGSGGSNAAFLKAVLGQFGSDKRQRPLLLKPAGGLEKSRFLGGR